MVLIQSFGATSEEGTTEVAGAQHGSIWVVYRTLLDYPEALLAVQRAMLRTEAEVCPKCGCGVA